MARSEEESDSNSENVNSDSEEDGETEIVPFSMKIYSQVSRNIMAKQNYEPSKGLGAHSQGLTGIVLPFIRNVTLPSDVMTLPTPNPKDKLLGVGYGDMVTTWTKTVKGEDTSEENNVENQVRNFEAEVSAYEAARGRPPHLKQKAEVETKIPLGKFVKAKAVQAAESERAYDARKKAEAEKRLVKKSAPILILPNKDEAERIALAQPRARKCVPIFYQKSKKKARPPPPLLVPYSSSSSSSTPTSDND